MSIDTRGLAVVGSQANCTVIINQTLVSLRVRWHHRVQFRAYKHVPAAGTTIYTSSLDLKKFEKQQLVIYQYGGSESIHVWLAP